MEKFINWGVGGVVNLYAMFQSIDLSLFFAGQKELGEETGVQLYDNVKELTTIGVWQLNFIAMMSSELARNVRSNLNPKPASTKSIVQIAAYQKPEMKQRRKRTNPSAQIEGNRYDINKLLQMQSYTQPDHVTAIKEAIIQNGPNSVPPIAIRIHHGQALVVDEHHRLEVFRQLGYDRVPIIYLRSSQLGKCYPNGDYFRTLEELLDAAKEFNSR